MAKRLISFLYAAFALLLMPPLALFLLLRRDLRAGLWRRFFPPAPTQDGNYVWFHAASTGEARQAAALARLFKQQHPEIPLLVTCNTSSGIGEARRSGVFDACLLFPFDNPLTLRRIFRLYQPRLLALIESEYWPGLLGMAARNATPALVANARLNGGSRRFFKLLNFFSGGALKNLTFTAADDSERANFIEAGVAPENLRVCNNIKVDLFLAEFSAIEPGAKSGAPLWLAASTHKGEEDILLNAFRNIRKSRPALRLVIAPRHVARAPEILESALKFGLSAAYVNAAGAQSADVEIVSEFGGLAAHFARADFVFVGGSLVDCGGHNLLEPILAGKPLFCGPHAWRWRRWAETLVECGAAQIVGDAQEIENVVADFLDNSLEKSDSVKRAQQLLDTHRGALLRNFETVLELFERGRALGD